MQKPRSSKKQKIPSPGLTLSGPLAATMPWDIPVTEKTGIDPAWTPEDKPLDVTLYASRGQEVKTTIWDNPIESGDVLALRAKKFVELLKDGADPDKAAESLGSSVEAIRKTRPDVEKEVTDLIGLYGSMPPEIRKAHVRATQTKIMMDNVGGSLKQQELALKASMAIGDDSEVQVYKRGVLQVNEAPAISESFAKLLSLAPIPDHAIPPPPEAEDKDL